MTAALSIPTGARSLFAAADYAREGDARLRAMVREHFDLIWRSLRGLGVPAAAVDDACQTVFMIALRRLPEIAHGSERAFLFATARGVASNARRSERRNREDADSELLESQECAMPSPEHSCARAEARRILEQILDGMQEDERAAFVLFELEGLTASAIADVLGIPSGTVASRLRRARQFFEQESARFVEEQRR